MAAYVDKCPGINQSNFIHHSTNQWRELGERASMTVSVYENAWTGGALQNKIKTKTTAKKKEKTNKQTKTIKTPIQDRRKEKGPASVTKIN